MNELAWLQYTLMKNKHLLTLFLLIISTCIFLWVFVSPIPDLDYMVNSGFGHRGGYYTIQPALSYQDRSLWRKVSYITKVSRTARPSPTEAEKVPGQYSKTKFSYLNSTSHVVPVISSAVHPGNLAYAQELLQSARYHLPSLQVVFHDIGLRSYEKEQLSHFCNKSVNCVCHVFPYDVFPFHVRNLETKAYKPLIIQDALNEFGAILWVDLSPTTYSFISDNLTSVLARARRVGLAAWTISEPTSALTHPKTLSWFRTHKEKYYFHRMISTSHMLLVNSELIHLKVVRPWVTCALAEDCIQPVGAQNFACNYARKPLFRYSGCHAYEMAALNVVLGRVFHYDWRPYAVQEALFGRQRGNETETLNAHLSQHKLFR